MKCSTLSYQLQQEEEEEEEEVIYIDLDLQSFQNAATEKKLFNKSHSTKSETENIVIDLSQNRKEEFRLRRSEETILDIDLDSDDVPH